MNEGYAICLNEWALDKDIKNELGLLLIISSLCAEKGFCYASNQYLSELFDISEETISRKIKTLEDKKYITIEYKKRGCEILERNIRLTKISIDDYQKYQSTIDENVKENNTSINNTINNNIYSQVIEHLNQKTSKNFKSSSQKTQKFIQARLNEGFSLEDFKKVIDTKTKEWKNDKTMCKYLMPETLFRYKI